MNQPILILIRGLPGSGKTTLSARLAAALGSARRIEVDDWLPSRRASGITPAGLRGAHVACLRRAEEILRQREDLIVANCFVRAYGLGMYCQLARMRGATCILTEPDLAWETARACLQLAGRDGANWIGADAIAAMARDALPSQDLARRLGIPFLAATEAEKYFRGSRGTREQNGPGRCQT